MIHTLTISVNFLALVITVWLGMYIVTRNLRSLVAWLTGITLWMIAG